MDKVFEDRTISSFGVSIGTGIMLESVFKTTTPRYDEKREIPTHVNIDMYKYHIYNAATLARNILSSVKEKDKLEILKRRDFIPTLLNEISTLNALYVNTKCAMVLFIPEYKHVLERINHGKSPAGDIILAHSILSEVNKLPKTLEMQSLRDTYKLPRVEGPVLITSHACMDLLNKNVDMIMLESHTGKIKNKYEWYTKYHNIGSKPMQVFPFMEELLYVLGDGAYVYHMPVSLRTQLHTVAVECNWTFRTTRDKILTDIRHKCPEIHDLLKHFKNSY